MILDARLESAHPPERWQEVDPDLLTTLADEIASLSAHLHAETRRLLSLIAAFDRLEGWRREGFSSCAESLVYRTRLDKATAREKVRVARALVRLPETDAAMGRGELSFSQVRALTRVADAESESELLEHACSMSAAGLERLVRSWKKLGRAEERGVDQRRRAARCLSVFPDEDGSYLIRGKLDPEVGALLMRAIEAAQDAQYRGSVPDATPEQRRADAIGLLAERALAAGFGDGGEGGAGEASAVRADRYLVVLHADTTTLAEEGPGDPGRSHLEDGTRVSAEPSGRAVHARSARMSLRETFERSEKKRRGALHATRSWSRWWRGRAVALRSKVGPGRFRPASGERSSYEIAGAASPGAGRGSRTRTTSDTGRTVAPRGWITSSSSAAPTTDSSMSVGSDSRTTPNCSWTTRASAGG